MTTDVDDDNIGILIDEEFLEDAAKEVAVIPEEVTLAEDPLFVTLLRETFQRTHEEDVVLNDFVGLLAGNISMLLAGKSAKGGDFAEGKEQEGKSAERYKRDQNLRAHLCNGLLPAYRIATLLAAWGAPRFRLWDEQTRRLLVAGFLLHDWIKMPDVQEALKKAGVSHDPNPAIHTDLVAGHFRDWSAQLNLTSFLEPIGGAEYWLYDLIYIAVNTQRKWGTMLNPSALPRMELSGPRRLLLMELCELADKLAYTEFTAAGVAHQPAIRERLMALSDKAARLTFHHVTENRGVLTNLLHNATLELVKDVHRVPLLYAPSGVVYLERVAAVPVLPPMETIGERVIEKTRAICAERVREFLPGFKSSPTGFRFPDFYWLFFDLPDFLAVSARAAQRAIPLTKPPRCGERFKKAGEKKFLPPSIDINLLPVNTRVDQLGELVQLWDRLMGEQRPGFGFTDWLFARMGISDFRPEFDQIVTGGATGGVAHNWYVAAAVTQSHLTGLDEQEWDAWLTQLAQDLAEAVRRNPAPDAPDRWAYLRNYTVQTVRLDTNEVGAESDFGAELRQYETAKKKGRGASSLCSLCGSAFPIEMQQESAVLFAPAIYSNRLGLHGGKTQRSICAVCSLEMMLRQLLMVNSGAAGKNFEARKERYLFFYPTYFFTPETLGMLRVLHNRLKKVSLTALRRLVLGKSDENSEVHIDAATLQRLEDLLLAPRPVATGERDPLSRLRFPDTEPLMFDFIGIPPGRDPTDTEAWAQPTLLAMLLPLQLDVKVVVSESPVPLFREAGEFPETLFLDAPATAIRNLVGKDRLTLDDLTKDNKGALQALLSAYFIHTDVNFTVGRGGPDYRWGRLPALARDFASHPLHVFHYLKKWQRDPNRNLDGLPFAKVQQYLQYYGFIKGVHWHEKGVTMSHAHELVTLYRRFYRAEGFKSNAILRPVTVAANALLDADPRLHQDVEALYEVVWGEVQGFVNRVRNDQAQGRSAPGITFAEADVAVKEFSRYLVYTLYEDALKGDVAALRGRQLNLLKNAIEVLYTDMERTDRATRQHNSQS